MVHSGLSYWYDWNYPFHLTTLLLSLLLLICILLTSTYPNTHWLESGLYNWNVLYHWVCGISKISNKNFCWTERTIKLDVVGLHLLCLGLTRDFNKNNLKNVPLKALYCVFVIQGYTQSTTYISRAVIKRRGPEISPGYPKHSHTHEKISIVIVTWEITPCAAVSLTAVPLSK